jgi:hypothetical protein
MYSIIQVFPFSPFAKGEKKISRKEDLSESRLMPASGYNEIRKMY